MFIPNRLFIPGVIALFLAVGFILGIATPTHMLDYPVVAPSMGFEGVNQSETHRDKSLRYPFSTSPGPVISAKSAIVVDVATRTVLYAKEPMLKRAPASTTKILTALVALETGDLNDVISIGRSAALTPGSSLHLKKGEKLTLENLLKGLLMRSGNDAAKAIAQHIGGDVTTFARMMNSRAKAAGAGNSNFVNPHGLDDPNHYTTAKDLALITLDAIENPVFAGIVRTRTAELNTEEAWKKEINNTNQLLWSFDGAEGVKTGTTNMAGNCLVSLAGRRGRQVLAVVLGSGNRYWDSKILLDYGFNDFSLVTASEKGEIIDMARVEKGMEKEVALLADTTSNFIIRNEDLPRLELMMRLPTPIEAPLRSGQIIGRLVASVGEQEYTSVPLKVKDDIRRRTWWRLLWEWTVVWIRDITELVA